MSFNTSNIQADTFTGVYSITAPIHYVDGIPLIKNGDNLKLGNESNSVVECLELESSVSVSAPLGQFDLVSTAEIVPIAGIGASLLIDGSLNMQNYGISNLSSLTLNNGATGSNGQVLSVSGGSLIWKNDSSGDVSQWATFTASSTVNLGAQSLNGAYNKGEGINVITDLLMNNNSIIDVSNILTTLLQSTKIESTNANISNITGVSTIGPSVIGGFAIDKLKTLTLGDAGVVGLENQVISVDATGSLVWKTDAAGDVSQWANFDAVQDVKMNNYAITGVSSVSGYDGNQISFFNPINMGGSSITGVNEIAASSASASYLVDVSSISGTGDITIMNNLNMNLNNVNNSNVVDCQKIECDYRLENTFYVSPNGSDSTGKGNIESPFASIQKAIDDAEASGSNLYYYIMVMPGNYTENITITKKLNLIGMASSPYSASVGCVISGSVTINVGNNGADMFNNAVNISGFLIGSLVSFVSTENSILNIENCYLYSDDNASGRALYFNPSCANSRLRLTNTIIVSGGSAGLDPLVEITSVSQVLMNNCYFSAKGLQNVLKLSGTATCDTINTVKFESSNSGANIPAIVEITATVSATYTFSNCGFIYASATNKSANAAASGIYSNSATGNNRIVALYCSFFLLGTSSALNYAIQDAYHGGASQMIVLYYMNGASLQNAFAIHANNNQNKFQLQIVS